MELFSKDLDRFRSRDINSLRSGVPWAFAFGPTPFAVFAILSMVGLQNEPMKSLRLAIGFNKLWQRMSHRRASSYLPASLCTALLDRPGISTPPGVSSWPEMLSFGAVFMVDGPSVKPYVRPVATPFRMDGNVVPLVLCG